MEEKKEALGLFEKYLSLWVAICITLGIILGNLIPNFFQAIASFEYANVNLVVAFLIWVMIYPMMIQVDFSSISQISQKPKGLLLTLVINWLIKPFTMAFLGWLFFIQIYPHFIQLQNATDYIAGMILLGVAPCTAMVFVWSQLTDGDPVYTLVQVSVNDLIMIFAFAPIAALLLGVSNVVVPWETLFLSVFLYVLIPLVAGWATRRFVFSNDESAVAKFTGNLKPLSILGLLGTVVILFGFQASVILEKPLIILLIAIPLLIQTYGIFVVAYAGAYLWRVPHKIAAPAAMIGTSNFFELAVAVAISLFGLNSGAALATVVGVLVEVPVMLSLVAFANYSRESFSKRILN